MQKEAARKLIQETLEGAFDKERFTLFIKNLLNRLEYAPFPRPRTGQMIFADFRNDISSLDRVGKYVDSDDRKLDVLIVKLSSTTSLDKARSKQRNFVAKYLKESQGGQYKDGALVAFVSPDEQDWRFSFVKMEYKFDTTKKGRPKVVEEFTPARRYSFLVGESEKSHTAQSRLLPILANTDQDPTLVEIEEAFSIEKVTKEFFENYRSLFHEIRDALDEFVNKDKATKADFEEKGVDTVDFAKKLLGQIVFLYFLQKKGWFGVARNKAWGTGSKNFLRLLFEGKMSGYDNFFNDILEPLFYEALAVERQADYYSPFKCKIPFLNGGLFDPLNNYDWVHTDILIPDELFSNDTKTKQGDTGTGILDVLDRYNFTVKEDEPLEKEVAIDPEMLGKVFENLLEVKDRKSKGTYYTPREIVHYMCQESLINYLATELKDQMKREDIETLIKHGETALENDALVTEQGEERGRYKYKLPQSVRDYNSSIDRKLADIKVCDPAVGSGAFLVGMMSEIVKTRSVLARLSSPDQEPNMYDFKRDAIQDSLHGVDLDLGAVEIAKLRLWLSLIVDEENYKHIKPLPNLDYKIMQGNSLLEEYEGIKLIDERFFEKHEEKEQVQKQLKSQQSKLQREYFELHSNSDLSPTRESSIKTSLKSIDKKLKALDQPRPNGQEPFDIFGQTEAQSKADKLLELHEQFFGAYHKREKDHIHKEIDSLTWDLIETTLKLNGKEDRLEEVKRFQLTKVSPFFLWKLNFTEVFRNNKGFDVVIANPPYVSHDKIREKSGLKSRFQSYEAFADIYCYFLELGVDLLKPNGVLCFITSNSYLRAAYGAPLRRLLSNSGTKLALINIEDAQVFESAIVNTAIVLFSKSTSNLTRDCRVVNATLPLGVDFSDFVAQNTFTLSQSDFDDQSWSLVPAHWIAVRNKIRSAGTTLSELNTKIRLGLATGANNAFVLDEATRTELIKKDANNSEIIKPVLRGRDIFHYAYRESNHYLILSHNGISVKKQFPTIYEYLKAFGPKFRSRGAKGKHWSNLRACSFIDDFEKEKIVWIELTDKPRFALCKETVYLLNTAYFMLPPKEFDAKYLLAILNSKLMSFYLSLLAATSGMGTLRWINVYVKEFPIARAENNKQNEIIEAVDAVLDAKQDNGNYDTDDYEKQIDSMIYDLYGLTPDEIAIVEGDK